MMNVQDWLPTLYSIAGGSSSDLPPLDGLDMWSALSEDLESPRNLMLHNIDESRNIASVRVGDWKLVKGTTYQGSWDAWVSATQKLRECYHFLKRSRGIRFRQDLGIYLRQLSW